MILAAAVAFAVAQAPVPAVRGVSPRAPRYVRLRLDVVAYGIPGRGEMVVDRSTGRFVRRLDAGPASEREGFDGTRAWRADATGMPRVQGNDDQRGAIVAAAYLFARAPRPDSVERADADTVRVHFHGLSRPVDVDEDPVTHDLTRALRPVGEDRVTTTFRDYRTAKDVRVPFALTETSNNGAWTATVRAVETPRDVAAGTFSPPPPPHDTTLRARTRIALDEGNVMNVRINDGDPMRFLLDSGGQNAITPAAAARLGMRVQGSGKIGGAGAGEAPVRYAFARRMQIGAAEMRDQPFLVIDFGMGAPFDGIVGYELLARFAARLDIAGHALELAPDAAVFGKAGIAVPMTFDDRQPQVNGAIDGIAAALTLDTGSSEGLAVNTPFVRANRLVERYHTGTRETLYAGVGGNVDGWLTDAREVRFGDASVRDVRMALTDAQAGSEIDPSVAANVGDRVLRRFTIVFDYRRGLLRLEPVRESLPRPSPAPSG